MEQGRLHRAEPNQWLWRSGLQVPGVLLRYLPERGGKRKGRVVPLGKMVKVPSCLPLALLGNALFPVALVCSLVSGDVPSEQSFFLLFHSV